LLGATTVLVVAGSSLGTACSLVVSTSDLTGGPPLDAAGPDDAAGSGDATRPDSRDGAAGDASALDAAEEGTGPPDSGTTDAGSAKDSNAADAPQDSGAPPDSGSTITTTDLTPTQDAYVDDTSPGMNFGTSLQLIVKSRSTSGYNRNSWLSFDIAGFKGITLAKLRLYVNSVDTAATNAIPVVLYYPPDTVDGWTASTITWNNAPAYGTNMLGTVSVNDPQVGTWIEYDVTAAVAADSDGVSTFLLTSTPSTDRGALFDSSRATNSPILRITGVHP
jgi:hypothetical protein